MFYGTVWILTAITFVVLLQVALFKFVRMAGDLLPAPLYVPYINMLIGLANSTQNAQHCFNLLKMNGKSVFLLGLAEKLFKYFIFLNTHPIECDTKRMVPYSR